MKASRFRLALDEACRVTGRGVYTKAGIARTILAGESARAVEKTIATAIQDGVLIRLCRGIYAYRYALAGRPVRQEAVLRLRPRSFSYISLETALSHWGVVSQATLGAVTAMTSGRSGRFDTPYGRIDLTHTNKAFADVVTNLVPPEKPWMELPVAKPRLAARDLVRVGRNTDLVLWDELDAIEAEVAG